MTVSSLVKFQAISMLKFEASEILISQPLQILVINNSLGLRIGIKNFLDRS